MRRVAEMLQQNIPVAFTQLRGIFSIVFCGASQTIFFFQPLFLLQNNIPAPYHPYFLICSVSLLVAVFCGYGICTGSHGIDFFFPKASVVVHLVCVANGQATASFNNFYIPTNIYWYIIFWQCQQLICYICVSCYMHTGSVRTKIL